MLSVIAILAAIATPVMAHGELAGGEDHDNPSLGELLLTPIVVGVIHVIAMVALLFAAWRARTSGSVPDPVSGPVPDEAEEVFGQFLREDDSLSHAFRPNRRMYIISKNLPHFFVLTGLATFFSVYTYQWLGDNTVYVYTSVHASAIVVLFLHSAAGWKNAWYGVSPLALYTSFGTFSPLAISMPLRDLDSVEVKESRLKGLLDVSALHVVFLTGEPKARVDIKMRAIDSPDKIKEVIIDETAKSTNEEG
ncbi:MAG: PH domain-containing protein [Thermoplasmata archaeon]|nr:MAG: PH domain-containing protein [Thermoplasmata archaeon]